MNKEKKNNLMGKLFGGSNFWGGSKMKVKRFINTILGILAMVVMVTAVVIPEANAQYPYEDMGLSECTVRSNLWDWGERDRSKLPLPVALAYANGDFGSSRVGCTHKIALEPEGDEIFIFRPMTIRRGGGEDLFIIIGEPSEGTKVTLDAQFFDMGPGEAECLITIDGSNVLLKNIEIINVPRGMDAICINHQSVTLDNVAVSSVHSTMTSGSGESDGIVFAAESTQSIIKPNSSVTGVNGYGIVFNSSEDSLSNARLWPVATPDASGEITSMWSPTESDRDDYGFVTPPDTTVTFDISLTSVSKYFKNDNSKLRIVTRKVQETSDPSDVDKKLLWFQAWVVEDSGDNDIASCDFDASNLAENIQIYNSSGFYKFIGPYEYAETAGRSTGLGRSRAQTGAINVYFDPDDASTKEIAMVPAGAGGRIGKPLYVSLTGEWEGDCPNRPLFCMPGDTNCRTTEDDGDPVIVGGTGGFKSVAECQQYGGIWSISHVRADSPYDSDGDGLFDDDEDLNKNCKCEQELGETCWDDPDTDNDGIPDGKEPVCAKMNMDTGRIEKVLRCGHDDVNNTGPDVEANMNADPDGDGLANAVDVDSDNDGRYDYQEDRSIYYETLLETLRPQDRASIKGLLYTFNKGSRDEHPIIVDSNVVECELGTSIIEVGIRYDWYHVTYASDGETIVADPGRIGETLPEAAADDSTTTVREIMVCRHTALASANNFDGRYSADNLETMLYDVNTDGDRFCDGPGSNCGTHVSDPYDKCPTVNDDTNECKIIPCSKEILLYGVNPDYVHYNTENVPDYLMLDNTNTYPKVLVQTDADGDVIMESGKPKWRNWQDISIDCFGDLDKDGIPNCVEAPSSLCSADGVDEQTKLAANRADTDGDGLIDGWHLDVGQESDVCPTVEGPGGIDRFVEGGTSYSCNPRLVYEIIPIVSCFLDRDGDGLRDCEEDKNMDGDPNDKVQGVAGIGVTESDPLMRDTDGDTISDYDEVKGWPLPTNPAFADTDEDGLFDNEEDRDGDGVITYYAESVAGEDRCPSMSPDGIPYDTSPLLSDTDGDGLDDKTEISGSNLVGEPFYTLLASLDAFAGGGIDVVSNPVSVDSDGDGIWDGDEYGTDGVINYNDSHPCLQDSDDDTVRDDEDGCPLNDIYADAENCGMGAVGSDRDRDGMSDVAEARMGTDPNNPDTDGDGLLDGEEDNNGNGIWDVDEHESNPLDPDTDGDGLNDGLEVRYGTDPTNEDSDGDCIPDGLEDANLNGDYNAGAETNALASDTDGDGLADGQIGGVGEDLNCNGFRDSDENGRWVETDPRLPDSDFDGIPDYDEMTTGGYFNLSNVGRASTGREGCMSVAGSGAAPTSMIYLFGLLLLANRIVARRTRKK